MALTVGTLVLYINGSPLIFSCGPIAGGTGTVNARLFRAPDNGGTPGTFIAVTDTTVINDGNYYQPYNFTDLSTGSYWFMVTATDDNVSVDSNQVLLSQTVPSMRLSAFRRLIRFFARHAGDSTYYPTTMVDFAGRRAAAELIEETKLLLRTDTFNTSASQQSYTLTQAAFRPDRIDTVWLSGANVTLPPGPGYYGTSYDDGPGETAWGSWAYSLGAPASYPPDMGQGTRLDIVSNVFVNDLTVATDLSGQPTFGSFTNNNTLALFPIPDNTYTVNYRWVDFFTAWETGVALTSATVDTNGVVTSVSIIDGSDNYTAAPTVSFVGGTTDVFATGTAVINSAGSVTGITITDGGSNYFSTPTVLLNGADTTDVSLNLAPDYLNEVVSLGGPAFLQFNEPTVALASPKGQEFRAWIQRMKSQIGGLGQKVLARSAGRRY